MQLENFLPFPKANKQFYRYRSIPLFFYVYCIPTFMMILNRMMDILWQAAAAVTNCTTTNAWTFKLKFFETKSTTFNGNALFTENKLYENENKGLICGELMWRNTTLSKTWLRKYFFRPVTKFYVLKTTIILRIYEFAKYSHVIAWAPVLYFFMRTT